MPLNHDRSQLQAMPSLSSRRLVRVCRFVRRSLLVHILKARAPNGMRATTSACFSHSIWGLCRYSDSVYLRISRHLSGTLDEKPGILRFLPRQTSKLLFSFVLDVVNVCYINHGGWWNVLAHSDDARILNACTESMECSKRMDVP
jgi:hypothetical protein